MRLALSMIVRNAARLLPDCIASAKPIVDLIAVADTGSTDDTITVAESLGASVVSIPWTNDFAAARNLALEHVESDWVLSLDADELLDPAAARQIPPLLRKSSAAGYQVTIRNYVLSLQDRLWDRPARPNDSVLPAAQRYPAYVEHDNVRLFRRDPKIRFVGRVHESVGPSILAANRKLGKAGFLIHHFGLAADEKTRAAKNLFYRQLGRRKILEMPENAQAHLELGLVEMDNFSNLGEAQRLFARARSLSPQFALAWFFEGVALSKLERHEAALSCFERAEHLGQRTALTAEMTADSLYNLGQFSRAAGVYSVALQRGPGNPLVESKLALAELRCGNAASALDRLRRAVASQPDEPQLHERVILALVWTGNIREAAQAADQKLQAVAEPAARDFLRAASLWAKLKEWPRAKAALESGLALLPGHAGLRQGLEEVEFSLARHKQLTHTLSTP